MTDIEKLSVCSEMAKKYAKNYELIDINEELINNLSFHPNGKTGTILTNDDYCFDIKCNHLIWVEGFCENTENFWKDGEDYNAILLMGNYKGILAFKMLVFHNN